ncbi:Alpha/Beta hydrolase protein [Mrakia frigida]|uniref:alpha/beta fold hydrolase n=1 Tax=Mrakia frigida TaxID=29902 RepID=UPI003FCBF8D0
MISSVPPLDFSTSIEPTFSFLEKVEEPVPSSTRLLPASIFNSETCTSKGYHQIDAKSGEHEIYYELHGSGPHRILLITGLNNTSFAWVKQVEHFASDPRYSVLVFDPRGAGNSSSPEGRFTTSNMAQDASSLLAHLGWVGEREIHVVGVSLGGMVALELAFQKPTHLASLTICVSSSGHVFPLQNLPPWKGIKTIAQLIWTKPLEEKIRMLVEMQYPSKWLNEIDPHSNRTNFETTVEEYHHRLNLTRPQPLRSNLSQSLAALTHHVSPSRLRLINEQVPKIVVLTGDEDSLVRIGESARLVKEGLTRAEAVVWEGTGHAIQLQRPKWFNALLERVFEEGRGSSRFVVSPLFRSPSVRFCSPS